MISILQTLSKDIEYHKKLDEIHHESLLKARDQYLILNFFPTSCF